MFSVEHIDARSRRHVISRRFPGLAHQLCFRVLSIHLQKTVEQSEQRSWGASAIPLLEVFCAL